MLAARRAGRGLCIPSKRERVSCYPRYNDSQLPYGALDFRLEPTQHFMLGYYRRLPLGAKARTRFSLDVFGESVPVSHFPFPLTCAVVGR